MASVEILKNVIIRQHRIYRQDLQNNPDVLYIFGDNEARVGHGGQAKEMRGEPNAFGIPTKKGPGTDPSCYWYDDDYDDHVRVLVESFRELLDLVKERRCYVIIVPADGIGTGLALLEQNAPRTFAYLQENWQVFLTL